MVEIDTVVDTIAMLVAIAVLGLVGGFVGKLVADRSGSTGAVERPRRTGRAVFDLGSWAALPVGAVAALVAALFFSPVVTGEDGTSGTTSSASPAARCSPGWRDRRCSAWLGSGSSLSSRSSAPRTRSRPRSRRRRPDAVRRRRR